MKKQVEIASTNPTEWLKSVVRAVQEGATFPEGGAVYKGVMMRVKLEAPEDAVISESPIVRIIPVPSSQRRAVRKASTKKSPTKKSVEKKKVPEQDKKKEDGPTEES